MFLNSLAFAEVLKRMSEIEEVTINSTSNQELILGLTIWRQVMQRREKVMVDNIYRYSQVSAFRVGVFLVGPAHRSGVVEAIQECAKTDTNSIAWKLGL